MRGHRRRSLVGGTVTARTHRAQAQRSTTSVPRTYATSSGARSRPTRARGAQEFMRAGGRYAQARRRPPGLDGRLGGVLRGRPADVVLPRGRRSSRSPADALPGLPRHRAAVRHPAPPASAADRLGAAGIAPLPYRQPPPPQQVPVRPEAAWARAMERFATLRGSTPLTSASPMAVLRLPALSDVTVPSPAASSKRSPRRGPGDRRIPTGWAASTFVAASSAPSGPGARRATPRADAAVDLAPEERSAVKR